MTLAEIRKQFVKATNRYDLVTNGNLTTNVDNGANFFINQGIRFLDLQVDGPGARKRAFGSLSEGDYTLELEDLKAVERVWIHTSSDVYDISERNLLFEDFRRVYNEPFSSWDSGRPKRWTQNVVHLAPMHSGETSGDFATDGFSNYDDIEFSPTFNETGLLFYPKADTDYGVELLAKFFSSSLSVDTDKNWWTVQDPWLVIEAACYIHETSFANLSRAQSYLQNIQLHLTKIIHMEVEQELSTVDNYIRSRT